MSKLLTRKLTPFFKPTTGMLSLLPHITSHVNVWNIMAPINKGTLLAVKKGNTPLTYGEDFWLEKNLNYPNSVVRLKTDLTEGEYVEISYRENMRVQLNAKRPVIVVAHPTNIYYTNQVGGICCHHPYIEGYLIDEPIVEKPTFEFYGEPTAEMVGQIDALLLNTLDSEAWRTVPYNWRVCVERVKYSEEAWVWIKGKKRRIEGYEPDYWRSLPNTAYGILTWMNSD